MKSRIVIASAALCLIAAGGPAWAESAQKPDIAAGRALAERLCAKCHAIGKTGPSPFKPAPPFRTFESKWPLEVLEEPLAEGIMVGHKAMPEFKFAPEQIGDLLGYIASLNKP